MKKIFIFLGLFVLLFSGIAFSASDEVPKENPDEDALLLPHEEMKTFTEKGIVREIINEVEENTNVFGLEGESLIQYLEVEITKGPHKGQVVYVENRIDSSMVLNLHLKEKDKVLLYVVEEGGKIKAEVSDLQRDHILLILVGLFLLALILVGRLKGFKSFLMLLLTGVVIWKIYIPAILKGMNPILFSILSLTVVTVVTLIFIVGFNKKTLVAIIGTLGGLLIAGVIALISGYLMQLTGLGNEEAQMLRYSEASMHLDFRGLLFSGILIGALGAVMDVSMSIASSLYEMHQLNPVISKAKLFRSGMNVGKDVMGTMSNTLILAYTGSSIPLMLLFQANKIPLVDMINTEMIASEVVRAMAGSIGLVLTIPITAVVGVFLYGGGTHFTRS